MEIFSPLLNSNKKRRMKNISQCTKDSNLDTGLPATSLSSAIDVVLIV